MQLNTKKIVLTGSQGGIGQALYEKLKSEGAMVIPIGRKSQQDGIVCDFLNKNGLEQLRKQLAQEKIDVLINAAGLMHFGQFINQSPQDIKNMMTVNLEAPILLTQAVLPGMLERKSGSIVNIGSIFGALAFPHFSIYSMTKAALKSFSESLRREYYGKGVNITYIAPRAVKTSMNSGLINTLHQRTKISSDSPEKVAEIIVKAIVNKSKNISIGFSETLFTKINAILPSLIDQALVSKRDIAEELLQENFS